MQLLVDVQRSLEWNCLSHTKLMETWGRDFGDLFVLHRLEDIDILHCIILVSILVHYIHISYSIVTCTRFVLTLCAHVSPHRSLNTVKMYRSLNTGKISLELNFITMYFLLKWHQRPAFSFCYVIMMTWTVWHTLKRPFCSQNIPLNSRNIEVQNVQWQHQRSSISKNMYANIFSFQTSTLLEIPNHIGDNRKVSSIISWITLLK